MPYYPIARVVPYARSKAMVETVLAGHGGRAGRPGRHFLRGHRGNDFFLDIARGDTQSVVHGRSAKIAYPSKDCQRPVPG